MAKPKLNKQVGKIIEMVKNIQLVELSALQTTNSQKSLNQLQMAVGELSKAVAEKADKSSLLQKHDQLVQAIDTAGLIGLISNDELSKYYECLDDIWTEIENN